MRWTQKEMRAVVREERDALLLRPTDMLDPYALAREHGIEVYTLTGLLDFGVSQTCVDHFAGANSRTWSAALVAVGSARIIVENESHATVRRRASIAHELGHFLLEHTFQSVILGEDHKRQFDEAQEKQATFMAGELLVPLAAAQHAAFDAWDNARVARTYGVSEQFAQMQMYGQRVRAQRAAQRYGPRSQPV